MTQAQIIASIEEKLPQLSGKVRFEVAHYDATQHRALLSFLCDEIVGEEMFGVMKKILRQAFPSMRVSLRVASPSLADSFLKEPAQHMPLLASIIGRAHPASVSWLPELRVLTEGDALVLEMPDEFSLDYFRKQELTQLLGTAIMDIFRIQPPIMLRLRDDVEDRLRRIEQERAKEAALRAEMQQERTVLPTGRQTGGRKTKNGRIKGSAITEEPISMQGLNELSGRVVVAGEVVSVERRDIPGKEMVLLSFVLTDYSDSIKCKIFLRYRNRRFKQEGEPAPLTEEEIRQVEGVISQVLVGRGLKVRGTCQADTFEKTLVLMAQDISAYELPQRLDEAPVKRIELHAHTQMSVMDATVSAKDLIARAAKWGHEAIAITDHGVVQAYPEAFSAAKANKIRLIPGMEAYMIDRIPIVQGHTDQSLDDPIIVLDFETTGLNPVQDRIIEIGAVRLSAGQIEDSFSMLVNPGFPLPAVITQITGIKDADLMDAPTAAQALPQLMAFIGDAPLAAHNAAFDAAFLEHELARLGQTRRFTRLDTLLFAQKLYPDRKSYRLAAVCKMLGVSLKNAHRAVHDATATAQVLAHMLDEARKMGAERLEQVDSHVTGYTKSFDRHVVLLARTQQGLQNINRLVTLSHLEYYHRGPKVPRDQIAELREGLLVGSACSEGEIYQAVLANEPQEKLEKRAHFYDYLEIQPIENNEPLVERGLVADREGLMAINRRIVQLGEKLGIPVVATGDAHYLDPPDNVFRTVLHHSQHRGDVDKLPDQSLRTTQEMLDAFAWLGEEKAMEVVVHAPRRLLEQMESLTLYPQHPKGLTTFSPVWEGAEEDIRTMTLSNANRLYGDDLPPVVSKRIDKELKSIIGYGYATLYSIANKLVTKSLSDGYLVGSRGSVGSSLVATLSNITEVNPLPPHYRCPGCCKAHFDVPEGVTVGVDLPDWDCTVCGQKMVKDGFDIPFEVFLGFEGDKVPDIDLNFSGEYQPRAHAYVEELFGKGYVFRAGTIGTLQEKTAYGLVLKYMEDRGLNFSDAEKNR
ncbi:MAG: PolC-type DNA polymerase III, partial [Clostridiales bacterium]|nr:PolC-type DNA polymerase III [Clostridiales bacterium]